MSGYDSQVWGLCDLLVWIAIRSKDAVNEASAYPGWHHRGKIANSAGRHHDPDVAEHLARAALVEGKLGATGIPSCGRRGQIDGPLWLTLDFQLALSWGIDRGSQDEWRDVAFYRADILRLWPPLQDVGTGARDDAASNETPLRTKQRAARVGRPAKKGPETIARMELAIVRGDLTLDTMMRWKQQALADYFGVNRETSRKALMEVERRASAGGASYVGNSDLDSDSELPARKNSRLQLGDPTFREVPRDSNV